MRRGLTAIGLTGALAAGQALGAMPRPDHLVIVVEENHSFDNILGAGSPATYIKSLAVAGANFTQSYGIERPSQPNYLDFFSGSNQGITSNDFPPYQPFSTPNLGAQLRSAGLSFAGYSQGLPSVGSNVEFNGDYKRKHNPWANWQSASPGVNQLPLTVNQPWTNFPSSYAQLPTVSFIVPDQQYDMHDGSIETGDAWLQANVNGYYQWARTHNSMLIVTWDEDDFTPENHIPTIFLGPMIKPGTYSQTINHFSVLRTIEDLYGLGHIGAAVNATTISNAFHLLPGDVNDDAMINSGDFATLASHFNSSGQSWTSGDFTGDGIVNALDFNALAKNYGTSLPPSLGAAVPEPALAWVWLFAAVGIIRRFRS